MAAALAPLLVMFGVSEWAEDTEHDQKRVEGIQNNVGSPLKKFLGYLGFDKDAEIEAIRRRNRGEQEKPVTPPPQTIILQFDGRTVAEVVNDHNARQASRN